VHDPNSNSRQSRFFLRIIDKKVLKYIAVSNFIKQDLIKCGINTEKIDIIHNGILIQDDILPRDHSGEELTIGIAGQLIERKGHETLLEALSLLIKKNLKVKLIIAGNGDEQYISRLKKIYEGIDIIVAPTITEEPFGLIVIEANMLSIPVIVSNTGGFMETVKDGYNGYLVEPKNPVQIAEKIEYFYNDRPRLLEMGNNGREYMKQKFDKALMNDKIDNLLQNL
jgi:glycosyltransferase involved in cell wall biosynthesis